MRMFIDYFEHDESDDTYWVGGPTHADDESDESPTFVTYGASNADPLTTMYRSVGRKAMVCTIVRVTPEDYKMLSGMWHRWFEFDYPPNTRDE